jgi:diguanylate cyclase (GGDEF)-like protein
MHLGSDARQVQSNPGWTREIESLAKNFNALMAEVSQSHQQLSAISLHDGLTGLFNRRHFDMALTRAIQDANEGAQGFGLLMLDLNLFKPINDKYGHATGDAVLIEVAKTITATLRASDMAARVGGDEFAVLALGTGTELRDLAERLRSAIGTVSVRVGHEFVFASASVGVAVYPEDGGSEIELFRAADTSMYADKRANRTAGSRYLS